MRELETPAWNPTCTRLRRVIRTGLRQLPADLLWPPACGSGIATYQAPSWAVASFYRKRGDDTILSEGHGGSERK